MCSARSSVCWPGWRLERIRAERTSLTKTNGEMTSKPDVEWFSVRAVAVRLRVSERSVRRWINCGLLHAHHFGRAVRISKSELEAFERRSQR